MKLCKVCNVEKGLDEFYKHLATRDRRQSKCKKCSYAYRINNPPSSRSRRKSYYKCQYGISLEDYDRMFSSQKGVCIICKQPDKNGNLSVDHCHTTSIVRGLLCANCNLGLGHFKDSTSLLKAAIKYLKNS